MSSKYDILFWLGGGVVGAGAMALLCWALLGDRLRFWHAQRPRRCPRCWYDMSGTPAPAVTCSECGYRAKSEKKLLKFRRRWRWSFLAMLLLLIAAAAETAPKVRRDGWLAMVPTTAMIIMMPNLERSQPAIFNELQRRMAIGRLRRWQWRWLIDRCVSAQTELFAVQLHSRQAWPIGQPVRCTADVSRYASRCNWFDATSMTVVLQSSLPGAAIYRGRFEPGRQEFTIDGRRIQPWLDRTFSCGLPAPGSQTAEFKVTAQIDCRIDDATVAITAGTRTISMPIALGGSIEQYLTPISVPDLDAWLRHNLFFYANEGGFWMQGVVGDRLPLEQPLTLGVTAELLRNGEVIASGGALQGTKDIAAWIARERRGLPLGMFGGRWRNQAADWIKRFDLTDPRDQWSMRVHGDAQKALGDFDGSTYWEGEFIVPLTFDPTAESWHIVDPPSGKSARGRLISK